MEFARKRGIIGQGRKCRRLDRGLLPGHHQGRPDRAQAPVRALHQRGADAAGHRHRLRRQPPRGGDPVPLRPLRRGPLGHGLHRHLPRPLRRARGGQGAGLPPERSTAWPRRSTPATRATWPATWRWTAASAGCSTSSAWTWRAEAVPSNRDGRRTDGGALVARQSDSSWNHRPRPVLAPAPLPSAPTWPMPRRAPGTQRATTTDGRTASPAGCRRAGHGCSTSRSSRSSTRLGAEALRSGRPARRPGGRGAARARAARQRHARRRQRSSVVRVDPESGMPIEERRRPSILPSAAGRYRRQRSTSASGRRNGCDDRRE